MSLTLTATAKPILPWSEISAADQADKFAGLSDLTVLPAVQYSIGELLPISLCRRILTAITNQTLPFGDRTQPELRHFYILQSATNTVRIDTFGQNGDDPTVVGDYDGDGKADVAVYRSGASAGDQSTWYYRGSLTPATVNSIPWGQNGDFPAPGDYDGDGKNDFVIQRASGGSGVFWMNTTTAGISTITFGNSSDVVVPGDYDGDGKD